MQLTTLEIEKIAKLARLSLTDAEKEVYADQLSVVLEYIDMLNEVDVEGVEETTQVTGLVDVVREDVAVEISPEDRDRLIASFPEAQDGFLKVKAVFNDQ